MNKTLAALALFPLVVAPAYATVYLSPEQAQEAIFPGVKLTPRLVILTATQAQAIEQRCGIPVVGRILHTWQGPAGELFILDAVIGKHELISYAVGITAPGVVKQVEILEYRESYGQEVRNPAWRGQFVGKTAGDAVTVDQDIKNISGATLSSHHVTEGVKRLLATYGVVFRS